MRATTFFKPHFNRRSTHKIMGLQSRESPNFGNFETPTWVSQPYFEKSVRMRFTLPKWELESPPGLPKLQSSILGVKTPHIVAFFISLESYQNVDVENELV